MRKIVRIGLLIFRSILIFVAIGAFTTASVKNVMKLVIVEKFKSQGIYQEDISTDRIKYYRIESDEEKGFKKVGNNILPGAPGDILVSTQATVVNPLVSGLISFFAGGHAAICCDDYRDYEISLDSSISIEATGLESGANLAKPFNKSYWMNDSVFTEIMALRIDMNESEKKEVLSNSSALLGDPYNFSFIFDTENKSYCSDIVSKTYSKIGANLNKDGFTTSVYDLIVSSDTYLSYYHYYDNNNVLHIYYLG